MDRPYIFCHMFVSLDGKIMGNYMDLPACEAASDLFYDIAFGPEPVYRHQGWLSGRVTTDDNFTHYRTPDLIPHAPTVPAGDFVLTIANGLTLTYTETDRTCTLRFTDAAIAAGRTERKAVLDAPCRSLRVVGDASSLEIFLNDGAAVLSTRYYPAAGKVAVQLCGAGSTLYSLSI